MEIKIFRPKSALLKEHIECFYILERTADDPPASYLTYPGINQMVSLYADTATEVTPSSVTLKHSPSAKVENRIVGKFQRAVIVRYEGRIKEVTTLFKPLSINSFLERPFRDFATGHFPTFSPSPFYHSKMASIYGIDDNDAKLAALEEFWINEHKGFNHPFMAHAVDYLRNNELEGSGVNELCQIHQVSRQTLYQHFDKYIGKSPSMFRKIVRFRDALKDYHTRRSATELSGISAAANYFDQSHMIRDFRSVTGYTPRAFFNRIEQMDGGQINFMFLNTE